MAIDSFEVFISGYCSELRPTAVYVWVLLQRCIGERAMWPQHMPEYLHGVHGSKSAQAHVRVNVHVCG